MSFIYLIIRKSQKDASLFVHRKLLLLFTHFPNLYNLLNDSSATRTLGSIYPTILVTDQILFGNHPKMSFFFKECN